MYKQEDAVKRVLELTDGKGVDAIYDAVGKDTYVSVRSRVSPTLAREFNLLDLTALRET